MSEDNKDNTVELTIESMNRVFPNGRFSFGYLFNYPCPVESQQWYVFSQVPTKSDGLSWGHPFPRRHRFAFKLGGAMTKLAEEIQSDHFIDWLKIVTDDYNRPRHQSWIKMCDNKDRNK